MAEDKNSKTEQPTAKRKGEARKEGRIARSPELVSWISIFIAISIIQSTVKRGAALLEELMNTMGTLISNPDQGTAIRFMGHAVAGCVTVVAPLTLTFMVLGVVGTLVQVRFVFSTKSLKPSLKRLNPLSGFKRLFSPQSVFQLAKQAIKTAILGFIAYHSLHATVTGLVSSGPLATSEVLRQTATAVLGFLHQVALACIAIGLVDYVYQRRKIGQGMRMTKQEVKEESRQQDLAPEVRNKLRQKQRQMSRNRMMANIKNADVVIVNPVHIAVALKYEPSRGAPKVVAKGAGFIAERIREEAENNTVPLVQDIALARTLHRSCAIDDEIPAAMFEAVAKVLAFVFLLKARGNGRGFHKMPGSQELSEAEPFDNAREAMADA